MRPIKFRVWDKSLEEMRYSINIPSDYTERNGSLDLINMFQTLNQRYVFMQYTGFKDRNGREIYDGDIVRGKYGKNGIVKNYEIRWLIGHFAAVDRNNITGDEHYYPIGLLEGEVIGNIFQDGDLLRDSQSPDRNRIYENPELLEG